jgi:Putative beta-barrel porin 2
LSIRTSVVALALTLCAAVPAFAQDVAPDPFSTARFRFGAVAFSPGITVTNMGWDTNVFNEWENPKTDFTLTLTPQTDAWLRFGPARVKVHASIGYVYFADYYKERSWNTDDSVRFEVPLIHFRPYAGYSYLYIRDRPGFEVDARVRRTENAMLAGLDLPLTRKTTVGGAFKRTKTDYAEGATFNLRDTFNRTTDVYTASARYALTPLTTLLLDTEYVRERFEFSPLRNSEGFRLLPGVEFKPLALISGTARVGVRQLNFDSPFVPGYTGPVASVDLGYTLLGTTRFSARVDRDVAYSYDELQPYYILTGVTGTITQRLNITWDLQARVGNQRLAYQRTVSPLGGDSGTAFAPVSTAGRLDTVLFYGGGVGYRLGTDVRLGFNIDYYKRTSDTTTRQYQGLRAGSSVTYGF